MKRSLVKLVVLSLLALIPANAFGQGQINTKKMKIADITSKTLKVVLTANPFYDELLKDEFAMRWHISPYEFCSLEEFDKMKNSKDHYFFVVTSAKFRKENEPGIQFLTIFKGGEKEARSIEDMYEVVTIPFASADNPSGRETVFLPALLDIMQEYVLAAMESDKDGYAGIPGFVTSLKKSKEMDVVMANQDMSEEIRNVNFDEYNIIPMDEDDCDEYMLSNMNGVLVSYAIAPADPVNGSYCYKLLIDSGTHQLYYFKKHRITRNVGSGFLADDIKKIRDDRKSR